MAGAIRLASLEEELKSVIGRLWAAVQSNRSDDIALLRQRKESIQGQIAELKAAAAKARAKATAARRRTDPSAAPQSVEKAIQDVQEQLLEARRNEDLYEAVDLKQRLEELLARRQVDSLKTRSRESLALGGGAERLAVEDGGQAAALQPLAKVNEDAETCETRSSSHAAGEFRPRLRPLSSPLSRTAHRFLSLQEELERALEADKMDLATSLARRCQGLKLECEELRSLRPRSRRLRDLEEALEGALDKEAFDHARALWLELKATRVQVEEPEVEQEAERGGGPGKPRAKPTRSAKPKASETCVCGSPFSPEARFCQMCGARRPQMEARPSRQSSGMQGDAPGAQSRLRGAAKDRVQVLRHELDLVQQGLLGFSDEDDSRAAAELRQRKREIEAEVSSIERTGEVASIGEASFLEKIAQAMTAA